ncbi:MAG: alpha/beta hydrolase [Actinomycetota bacterium]|nr:alpha/beta hydrolase [Actinomycetota bacterium]
MTALVLLHAFPLSARMWDPLLTRLDGEVVAPQLPGFGGTPAPAEPPSLDAFADAVASEMDSRRLDRAALCGLSLGGYVAMAFARRHADRLAGLVLADTKASADPPAARDNRERIARTVLAEDSTRVLLDDVLPALLGPTTTTQRPEVVATVRGMVERADPAGVAWAQRAMAARPDSFDVLRGLRVPALVVVGEDDTLSPVADAQAMADALPDARLVVVPGAGHLTALEDPDAFAAAVVAFVPEVG